MTVRSSGRVVVALAVCAMLGSIWFQSAFQALATDGAPFTFPISPAPEMCGQEPSRIREIRLHAGTPAAEPPPIELEAAVDASPDVRDSVVSTIVELFACLNAGEPLRAYRLQTDDYLGRVLPQEEIEALATPRAVASDEWIVILEIRDVRLMEDGRVYATVVLDPALIPVEKMYGFVLAEQNGRWLIDDVLDELRFELP